MTGPEVERDDDPPALGARWTRNERRTAEVIRDAAHVVLEVAFVIGEIRVPPSGSWREQDIDAALPRDTPHSRMDGRPGATSQERLLEIFHERARERHHLVFDGLAFDHGSFHPLPSPPCCGSDRRGTEQQARQCHGSAAG